MYIAACDRTGPQRGAEWVGPHGNIHTDRLSDLYEHFACRG